MALKGEAKKNYQREYMRDYQRKKRGSKLSTGEFVNKTCQQCGYYGVYDSHHIDSNHNNNEANNILILCPTCHTKIHRRGEKLLGLNGSKQPNKLDKLREIINEKEAPSLPNIRADGLNLPIYNPAVHKPGDKVLIQRGKKWMPYLVPEVDKDGYVIPDYW